MYVCTHSRRRVTTEAADLTYKEQVQSGAVGAHTADYITRFTPVLLKFILAVHGLSDVQKASRPTESMLLQCADKALLNCFGQADKSKISLVAAAPTTPKTASPAICKTELPSPVAKLSLSQLSSMQHGAATPTHSTDKDVTEDIGLSPFSLHDLLSFVDDQGIKDSGSKLNSRNISWLSFANVHFLTAMCEAMMLHQIATSIPEDACLCA